MRAAVIVFPGSNCERDLVVALRGAGAAVTSVWHKEAALPPGTDLVGLPGGFAFGDYLRCGAIAARSPVLAAVVEHARRGGFVLGICNGFQILTEAGLLPGALMRNAGLRFVCRTATLRVATAASRFTRGYAAGATLRIPVAHGDGAYTAAPEVLRRLRDEDRVAFRYDPPFNGSADAIAGVLSANRRVLGMMPHPERAADPALGLTDGTPLFAAIAGAASAPDGSAPAGSGSERVEQARRQG